MRDWLPIWVLAWVWLRDRMVIDDPKLTTLRLAIPLEPAGLDLDSGVYSKPSGSTTLRAVEEEVLSASRSGRLRWSGRLVESGERRMIPELAFVEGVFDYDKGQLAGHVPSHTWHALRTEQAQILELWPETSAACAAICATGAAAERPPDRTRLHRRRSTGRLDTAPKRAPSSAPGDLAEAPAGGVAV